MNMIRPGYTSIISLLLLLPLGVALSAALLLPETAPAGLEAVVEQYIDNSGVSNPVTAVLLNFRSYDTLLEIGGTSGCPAQYRCHFASLQTVIQSDYVEGQFYLQGCGKLPLCSHGRCGWIPSLGRRTCTWRGISGRCSPRWIGGHVVVVWL